jgi:2-polyprenyl-3-methyl-5-hydroxy-6-metoxy-1,4-benzoquinol methylase
MIEMDHDFSMKRLVEHYNRKVNYYPEFGLEGWHLQKEVSTISGILNSILKKKVCKRALDIACHDGRYSFLLQEKGLDVVGIDTSEKSLAHAESLRERKKVTNVRFQKMDATELSLTEKFDIIILMELLHHLPDRLAVKTICNALNHLENDGSLILDLKNQYNPVIRYVYKKNSSHNLLLKARTMNFFRKTVQDAGARIVLQKGLVTPFWQIEPFVIVVVQKG